MFYYLSEDTRIHTMYTASDSCIYSPASTPALTPTKKTINQPDPASQKLLAHPLQLSLLSLLILLCLKRSRFLSLTQSMVWKSS